METCAINPSARTDTCTFRVQRRYECELEYAFFLSATTRLGIDASGISVAVDIRAHVFFLALGAAFKLAACAVSSVGVVCVGAQRRHRFA